MLRPEVEKLAHLSRASLNGAMRAEEDVPPDDLKLNVNAIRANPDLKAFQRKRQVAELVLNDLDSRGQLIRTQDDDLYFFERATKTLALLVKEDFRAPLYARFGLNATEDETRFIEREIITRTITAGEKAEVQRLSFWNRTTQYLYVSLNDGTMMKMNGTTIETVDNGTDGVLFLVDPRMTPVTPALTESHEPFNSLFVGLSLAGDDTQRRHMIALLKVWMLAVFFLHVLPVRPIVALVGEQGAGKTTLGRRYGLVLEGEDYEVGSFKSHETGEQDFLAAITSCRFAVFDNADSRIRWLPDHLAKLATGSLIHRRKLYTTNDCASYRPDCFLMLTSRDPRWKRDDVTKRLLPIRMDTIETAKAPEERLKRQIIERRPEIWGSMLGMLNAIIRELRMDDDRFTSNHRLADFHWFGSHAARAINVSEDFEAAMGALNDTQLDLLAEGDERLELFQAWTDTKPEEWDETLKAKTIYSELRPLHEGSDRNLPFKNGTAVGTWLGRYRELIEQKLSITVSYDRTPVTRAWRFQRGRCQGVTPENSHKNQRLNGRDTMTPSCHQTVLGDSADRFTPITNAGDDAELFEEGA